jgi:hypothetical protein
MGELAALQAEAKLAFNALPSARRDEFYEIARLRYVSTWPRFSEDAKAMCALLAFISDLAEPASRGN